MRRILFLSVLLMALVLNSQNSEQIRDQMAAVMAQPEVYYYGYSEGLYREETDQEALQELMSKICVIIDAQVSSGYAENEREGYRENMEKILNVYTYGRLQDVLQLDYKSGPIFHILRYIRKEDYQKIFITRKIEIQGFLREAEMNLQLNQLGIAFRNLHRAALLIESLPEGSLQHDGRIYTAETVLNQLENIASKIELQLLGNNYEYETRTVLVQAFFNHKPVNDLNIYYYDRHGWIPQKTNNSTFQLQLVGKEYEVMDKLSVKIDVKEEIYSSYSRETELLGKLFRGQDLVVNKELILSEKKIREKPGKYPINVKFNNQEYCPVMEQIAMNTCTLFDNLDNEILQDMNIFTDQAIADRMEKILSNNHVKLMQYPQAVDINKTETGWEIRQLGVTVSCPGFPTRNETAVIDFNPEGKIYNFCYTINPALHELFQSQGTAASDWDFRQIAIKFLEDYKTAYTTKDIDAVETLYSEDAIIITGKVVKRATVHSDIKSNLSDKEIIYFKRTKQEHIEQQRKLFQNNRFVWLQFDTFSINRAPIDKIYGISMKQNYFSSTYNDEGYLFLLIDFRGERPLIHVRNWQPGEWDLEKQMTLEDFRFF